MQVSHSFWDVLQQYFADGVMLPLFAIALVVLIREWNQKKRTAVFLICCTGILLVFNEFAYRVLEAVGERSTYYRFLWMCPLVLVAAFFIVKVLFQAKPEKRWMLAAVIAVMLGIFSSRSGTEWFYFPENIYQLDNDVIQVADTVMELAEGEPTYLYDNGDLSDTIRQYDARIMFTDLEVIPLDVIVRGYITNILGSDAQDAVRNNHSRFLVLKKSDILVYKVMETTGIHLVAETDNYYIYAPDYAQLYADLRECEGLQNGYVNQINVEYIPISDVQGTYEYIYISDFGAMENQEVYQELIQKISSLQPAGVIINDQLSANAGWSGKYAELLSQLQIPYYCNNQEIQVIEQEEFVICMMDNKNGISETALQELETTVQGEKSVVLVLSERVDTVTSELGAVFEEENNIVQVLSAEEGTYVKELLNENILQYATPVDSNQIFNIIRVK